MLKMEKWCKESFVVIGKEGSTRDGGGLVQRLWAAANQHFDEIAPLVKRDANGTPEGFFGAMTDFTRSFLPWDAGFTQGLYLAGAECTADAEAPEGWVKWVIPGFEYLRVECSHDGIFPEMIAYLADNGLSLKGAVHDFTCPKTGKNYMLFPVGRL